MELPKVNIYSVYCCEIGKLLSKKSAVSVHLYSARLFHSNRNFLIAAVGKVNSLFIDSLFVVVIEEKSHSFNINQNIFLGNNYFRYVSNYC